MQYSEKIEKTILGSALFDDEFAMEAFENSRKEMFYQPIHQSVYGIMKDEFFNGGTIDAIAIEDRLAEKTKNAQGIIADLMQYSGNANIELMRSEERRVGKECS